MKVSDTVVDVFFVQDSSGTAVTGLVNGDFTRTMYAAGVLATLTSTVTEIGSGYYSISYAMPASAAERLSIFVNPPTGNFIRWGDITGGLSTYDEDDIYAAALVPKSSGAGGGAPSNELTLRYVAGDTQPIRFNVSGLSLLTAYGSHGFGIRSIDATSSVDALTSITVDDSGNVSVTIAGTENFHTHIGTGEPSVSMRWDYQATKTSDSKKYTLARGSFVVLRQEYQA